MSIPRILHRLFAYIFGYFWLPCPKCGYMFGGHEKKGGRKWHTSTSASILCQNCPDDDNTEVIS